MVGKIDPRHGVEVYVGDLFDVVIKQVRHRDGEQTVILHRSEAREVIQLLQAAIQESEEIERQEAENS